MRSRPVREAGLVLLAVLFSAALMFAFVELPAWLDLVLQRSVEFPGFDPGPDNLGEFRTAIYVRALHLRTIGYVSLAAILALIAVGFGTRRTGWAWVGALGLFLPVFGQFALSMFFLAGLGILRAGWIPFLDVSDGLMRLGEIVHLPYAVVMELGHLIGWNAHDAIAMTSMAVGAFLFTWGVLVWIRARFSGTEVATGAIYRISRHPQYVGWIVWSYGFTLFGSTANPMKVSWGVPTSLPWLLSTMIIVGICLLEEMNMEEREGASYSAYRDRTPFLLPLPGPVSRALSAPARVVTRGGMPRSRPQVVGVVILYTAILMALSAGWIGLRSTDRPGTEVTRPNSIEELVARVHAETDRRALQPIVDELAAHGEEAVAPLTALLRSDLDPAREFAADALGDIGLEEGVAPLLVAVTDSVGGVARSAAYALGRIGSERAVPGLLALLAERSESLPRGAIYSALGSIGSDSAWTAVASGTEDPAWHVRRSALVALHGLDARRSLPFIMEAMGDDDVNVRRAVVMLVAEAPDPRVRLRLRDLEDDDDYEVRLYAREAERRLDSGS